MFLLATGRVTSGVHVRGENCSGRGWWFSQKVTNWDPIQWREMLKWKNIVVIISITIISRIKRRKIELKSLVGCLEKIYFFENFKVFTSDFRHIFQINSPSCNFFIARNPIKYFQLSFSFTGQKIYEIPFAHKFCTDIHKKNLQNRVKIASNEAEINFPIIKVRLTFCLLFLFFLANSRT